MIHEDYLLKGPNVRNNILDIIDFDFDPTYFRVHNGMMDREFTLSPTEDKDKIKDDGTVKYKYNTDYFRCDDFTNNHEGTHILFAGCSQTEGIGGNIENVWPTMVLDKLNDNGIKTSGYFNIAKSGFGWEKVISNFMVYVKKYGFPEYLFVLLPNIGRNYIWDNNERQYEYAQKYPVVHGKGDNHGTGQQTPKEYFESLMHFTINWRLFLEYCESNNVKILWSTWYYDDVENYKIMNISNNSFWLSQYGQVKFIRDQYESGRESKSDDIKKRDGHSGTIINEYWAKSFYEEAERIWEW